MRYGLEIVQGALIAGLLMTGGPAFAESDAEIQLGDKLQAVVNAEPAGEKVIDLGEKGLEDGEAMDPYFEQYLADGVQLRIPDGKYQWQLDYQDFHFADTSIVGEGEVILRVPVGHNEDPEFVAEDGGTLEIRGITIRGQGGVKGKTRVYTEGEKSRVIFRRFHQPDGSLPGTRSGVFVNRRHEGQFYMINCHIEGFADNGVYASTPGKESNAGGGEVHIVGGLYRNNNISNVRVGSSGSSVIGVVSVHVRPSPPNAEGARNQRGIRIRQPGNNIIVRNCDVTQLMPGNGAVVREGSPGGSGVIKNCRVRNDIDAPAIRIRDDMDWGPVKNSHLTGAYKEISGVSATSNICRGENCDKPRKIFRAVQ